MQPETSFVPLPGEDAGEVRAVAGCRCLEMPSRGRSLHVDDRVTDAGRPSEGYGAELLAWLVERAGELGCERADLESWLTRGDAHRFYADQGFEATSLHFARALDDDAGLGPGGQGLTAQAP